MAGTWWNALSWPPPLGPQILAAFREQRHRWTQGPAERNGHLYWRPLEGALRTHSRSIHQEEIPHNVHQKMVVLKE